MPPPAPADPFRALGLPPRFDLDEAAVHRAYLARVAALHPDLGGGDADLDESDRASASLNEARDTLADPERRAGALLALLGGPAPSEDRSLPDGFLMEMMDVRQRAEAECAEPEGLERWAEWAARRREASIREVAAHFARLGEARSPASLHEIRKALNAWRYVERMIEQLGAPTSRGAPE